MVVAADAGREEDRVAIVAISMVMTSKACTVATLGPRSLASFSFSVWIAVAFCPTAAAFLSMTTTAVTMDEIMTTATSIQIQTLRFDVALRMFVLADSMKPIFRLLLSS